MIRARIRVDGKLEGDLQALLGHRRRPAEAVVSEMAGQDTARGARGLGWRELAGMFNWPDGRSVGRMTGQWQTGAIRLGVEWLAAVPGRD